MSDYPDYDDPDLFSEIELPEPAKLMVAGDWHKSFIFAELQLERAKDEGCEAVIQLGDFGYWPPWEPWTSSQSGVCWFSAKIHAMAQRLELPVYWVDGNHENHEALHPGQGDQWLRHLPRGFRWQWWGKTWMAVGGGVSVDKSVRTPGLDWFPEEVLSMRQLEYCLREGDVDIVVAHDTVAEVEIPGIHGQDKTKNTNGYFPEEAIAESENHRALMSIIAEEKRPAYWFHGHYHERYNGLWQAKEWREAEGGPAMLVVGLDMQGSKRKNGVIITREDLP